MSIRQRLAANTNEDATEDQSDRQKLASNTNEAATDDEVEAHRLAANTSEDTKPDERERLSATPNETAEADEPTRLARNTNDALAQDDQRPQLDQHVLGQRIDWLACAIDGHQHDVVGARFHLPVLEPQSIETSSHGCDPIRYGGFSIIWSAFVCRQCVPIKLTREPSDDRVVPVPGDAGPTCRSAGAAWPTWSCPKI